MNKDESIYIAGHTGLVGSAITRKLKSMGYTRLLTATRSELDLRNKHAVYNYFALNKPEYVFLSAAKVGGILANATYPVEFLLENLEIQNNVISAAHENQVKKLLFLGSSCIYPKFAEQPINESALLTGSLEETNEMYALAKIAGIKLCQSYRKEYEDDFIAVMPTNLYGSNDNYDLESSHVLAAFIRKFHDAKVLQQDSVTLWGSGTPRREFMYVDDLADALVFLMQNYSAEKIVNIGSGSDIAITDLATMICNTVGYKGKIRWDNSKPDGTPRKLLDISMLRNLGWHATTPLETGITLTYQAFLDQFAN